MSRNAQRANARPTGVGTLPRHQLIRHPEDRRTTILRRRWATGCRCCQAAGTRPGGNPVGAISGRLIVVADAIGVGLRAGILRAVLQPGPEPSREIPHVVNGTGSADELAERRLVPERVEVGVLLREVTEARPPLEGDPKVTDRVLLAAGQRLAAGEVVERRRRTRSPRASRGRGRSPPRSRRPRTRDGTPPRPPSRRPRTACPTLLPTASTVVPASSANAVRFVSGRTNTSVPSGASTVSPSISNRARPRRTT